VTEIRFCFSKPRLSLHFLAHREFDGETEALWLNGYPFVFFAAMMIVQFFVVWLVYPETKGTSLEAVQKNLGIK
jgi:hypothetical protein